MIKKSKYFVVFTGAGISTSAGIPDYRSPTGLHAMVRGETEVSRQDFDFAKAISDSRPTIAHMALKTLYKAGILKKIVTSNHDNLHLLSGIAREDVIELHGNNFTEYCPECKKVYYRESIVPALGTLHLTGRKCSQEGCSGYLRDTVIRFGENLLSGNIENGFKAGSDSDLALVLGTSLKVGPANKMPLKSKQLVIVNLQKTPKDKKAKLLIHIEIDRLMQYVIDKLGLELDTEIGSLIPYDPLIEEEIVAKTLQEQIQLLGGNLEEFSLKKKDDG